MNRRGFFASLLAPFVARFRPKPVSSPTSTFFLGCDMGSEPSYGAMSVWVRGPGEANWTLYPLAPRGEVFGRYGYIKGLKVDCDTAPSRA